MTERTIYQLLRVFAVLLAVASAGIATAANLPDLGLSKQGVAVLSIVQACITTLMVFLPQANHPPGDVRGVPER
jgi:hypothetical protein